MKMIIIGGFVTVILAIGMDIKRKHNYQVTEPIVSDHLYPGQGKRVPGCCTASAENPHILFFNNTITLKVKISCSGTEETCNERISYIIWQRLANGTWKAVKIYCGNAIQFCGEKDDYSFRLPPLGKGTYRISFNGRDACGGFNCDNPTNGPGIFFEIFNLNLK